MSNSKPIPTPSEPSEEVVQAPEPIETSDHENGGKDIRKPLNKKGPVKDNESLNNGFAKDEKKEMSSATKKRNAEKGPCEEKPPVTKRWKKEKRRSKEEIAKAREEKRQALREAKRKTVPEKKQASKASTT